jgi:hypothetical protein
MPVFAGTFFTTDAILLSEVASHHQHRGCDTGAPMMALTLVETVERLETHR